MTLKPIATPRSTAILTAVLSFCLVTSLYAGTGTGEPETGVSITVYSSANPASFDPQRFIAEQRNGYNPNYVWQVPGYGVVKEVREVDLQNGANELRFDDVAQFIDPTTVSFLDLTTPDGTAVLEQNFEFDLVSPEKLMEKYLDRQISVLVPIGDNVETVEGKLLSAISGQLVIQTADGLRVLNQSLQVSLGELPGGLITKPTLVWKLVTNQAGKHKIRTTYQTSGITWRSDYNLILNTDDTKADLGAWVSLMNLSGAAYHDAQLKLIAGDVQRVQAPTAPRMRRGRAKLAMMEDSAAGFEEKAFFEYHMYTLPRHTDILANATQQITLFPTARDVNIEKVLVYYGLPQAAHWRYYSDPMEDRSLGSQSNPKVDVYLRFRNAKENHLGMPLPKGKIRVYKRDDADGTLEFIGEDMIDHTPKDEKLLIKLGEAFDVVGERSQTDYHIDTNRKVITESYRIELRNHKDVPQKIIIKENLFRWSTWQILKSSDDYEKVDARTIHFNVKVPEDGKKVVTYTVRYTW